MKKEILYLILFCISIIITYVIATLKAIISPSEFFFIFGCVLTLFISISLYQLIFFTRLQKKSTIQINENIPLICYQDKRKQCCIKEYIKALTQSDKIKVLVSGSVLNNYKLMLVEDLNKYETDFKHITNVSNKEVWVFSYDLSSEVLGDLTQSIARENIINGVKYIEFYHDDFKNHEKAEENKFKFLENIPVESKGNVSFIPLKNSSVETINILPNLLGSITFLINNKSAPTQRKSYFSLRGDGAGKREPIYFIMPNCMSNEYYNYFKLIKETKK